LSGNRIWYRQAWFSAVVNYGYCHVDCVPETGRFVISCLVTVCSDVTRGEHLLPGATFWGHQIEVGILPKNSVMWNFSGC